MTALDTKALLEGVTPGDWAIGEHDYGLGQRISATIGGVTFTICNAETPLQGGAPRHDMREANARLIASAPRLARRVIELEEALREIVTLTRPLVDQGEDAIWRRAVKIMDLATGLLNEGSSAPKGEG